MIPSLTEAYGQKISNSFIWRKKTTTTTLNIKSEEEKKTKKKNLSETRH